MYTIAITGAGGFAGGFIASYLESNGCKVFRFGRRNKAGVVSWDITTGILENPPKVDAVVHCAASVDDWATYKESYMANVLGTQNVLKSFEGVSKFIYISSASVYDAFCKQLVVGEDSCIGGKLLNAYSRTKLFGENEVKKSDIPSRIIFRPHIIYGPSDTTIGPRIKNAIKFNLFFIPGNGQNHISFTHVENLAQAVLLSIKNSQPGTHIYNITDKEPIVFKEALQHFKILNQLNFKEVYIPLKICLILATTLEFFYKLFKIKKSPLLTRYIIDQMSSDHIFDITKIKKELGYSPTRNIEHDFLL